MQVDLAIKSKNIITPSEIIDGMILISNGKIADIISSFSYGELPAASLLDFPIEDVGDSVVMPGIIDPSVCLDGGPAAGEIIENLTKAAATGGVTMLVELPLAARGQNFNVKSDLAAGGMHVDMGSWANSSDEQTLEAELSAGAMGVLLMSPDSRESDSVAYSPKLLRTLQLLKKYDKPLLIHSAYETLPIQETEEKFRHSGFAGVKSQSRSSRQAALLRTLFSRCRETGTRLHVLQVSSAAEVDEISSARKEGLPVTADTAQHYLYFSPEKSHRENAGTGYLPDTESLWQALRNGTIDFIASQAVALNAGKEDQPQSFMGNGTLELSLSAAWTGALERNISVTDMSRWLCENPARFLGLAGRKGKISKGLEADLCIWQPAKKFTVTGPANGSRDSSNPYLHEELYGVVMQTYLRGIKIFSDGVLLEKHSGRFIRA